MIGGSNEVILKEENIPNHTHNMFVYGEAEQSKNNNLDHGICSYYRNWDRSIAGKIGSLFGRDNPYKDNVVDYKKILKIRNKDNVDFRLAQRGKCSLSW
jgi:hypothetical protein